MSQFIKKQGGAELMYDELMRRVDKELIKDISIFNYLSDADFNKKTVYWNQLSYDQEAINFLNDTGMVNRIDHFVFVSYWQAETYRESFDLPDSKINVIKNACIGVEPKLERDKGKIKVCYTSTPWRGLDILLDAWSKLNPTNAELHVFSGTKIYGNEFYKSQDEIHKHLYNKCSELPNVIYRDNIPNDELRRELPSFDILAYPSTFEETSCISVIEAISAGLRVMCSSLGALPETTEGWARMYPSIKDRSLHVDTFTNILKDEIDAVSEGVYNEQSKLQTEIYSPAWSWDERIYDWEQLLSNIKNI